MGAQVELNDEGKIQVKETFNESAINGDGDTSNNLRDVSDSTLDESALSNQNEQNESVDTYTTATAKVLSIDDRENGEIYKNNLINNHINHNNNNNINSNHTPSSTLPCSVENDENSQAPPQPINEEMITKVTTTTSAAAPLSNIDFTETPKTECNNDGIDDVVINDSDNKRLLNNSNNDAVNLVGLLIEHETNKKQIAKIIFFLPFFESV